LGGCRSRTPSTRRAGDDRHGPGRPACGLLPTDTPIAHRRSAETTEPTRHRVRRAGPTPARTWRRGTPWPRRNETDELGEDSLEELKARRAEAQSSSVDVDETDFNENLELPGADLSNEELTVRVLPKQEDEFTCSSCFLVQHRSRLAATKGDSLYCRDCA
jgi:hypothetical protein